MCIKLMNHKTNSLFVLAFIMLQTNSTIYDDVIIQSHV